MNLLRATPTTAALLLAVPAHAQLFRAYVAPFGNDANPCTLAAPCRLLPAALNAVVNGGEIWMLDSANYNVATVSITKSVSILAVPGVVGSVVAVGGPAITVTANNLAVTFRNLVIRGLDATATIGVVASSGSRVAIEETLITGLPGHGVLVSNASVEIDRTTIRNTGGDCVNVADFGLVTVTRSLLRSCSSAVEISTNGFGNSKLVMIDSIADRCTTGVVLGNGQSGSLAAMEATVTRSSITNMSGYALSLETGVSSFPGGPSGIARLTLSGSTVGENGGGYRIVGPGSTLLSLGNNHLRNNSANTGALSTVTLQ